jgi:hypothetical protein
MGVLTLVEELLMHVELWVLLRSNLLRSNISNDGITSYGSQCIPL